MTVQEKNVEYYINGLKAGNRYILSEAITLVESTLPQKNKLGLEIISKLPSEAGRSLRIGITGSPGVGKSTFLESFGMLLIEKGFNIAILAVDPSSQKTKGSILGDKTRMEQLSKDQHAYIRPTASGQMLGGIAANTREAILLCEAAGYEIILVETVGVGQSETMVSHLVDIFLLLIMPGSGDDIQGIKRGIMELADIILINKADGDRVAQANKSKKQFQNALSLLQHKIEGWGPSVMTCSGLKSTGLEEVWNKINDFVQYAKGISHFEFNRDQQDKKWFEEKTRQLIHYHFMKSTEMNLLLDRLTLKIDQKAIKTIDAIIEFSNSLDAIISGKLK